MVRTFGLEVCKTKITTNLYFKTVHGDYCTSLSDVLAIIESCKGFLCNDFTCIDGNWKCDGIVDCTTGEDEDPTTCS